jgi:ribosomal protein S8
MSSIKGVIPPAIAKKKTELGQKGVVPAKSSVVKKLPPELRESYQKAPSHPLAPLPQPFHGVAVSKPMTKEEKKEAVKESSNPLLHPDQPLLKKKKKESSKQPVVRAASSTATTTLRLIKRTSNMTEHDRSDILTTDQEIELDEIDPLFLDYREKQDQIESKNPYQLDEEIYTPINRRSFYKFIRDTYNEKFKILPKPKGPIDEKACEAIESSKREGVVTAFSYQRFIAEYLRQASPYRGLLVYHGLGSGKTCSAIAAAEALYGTANKRIIVMTPFSLRPNFMSEISFCGFRHFNVNNHWVSQPLASPTGSVYVYAREILSLSDKYLKRVLQRPEDRQVIWIPDFEKPANFYSDEMTAQDREDIREQITNMIDSRITFISYNGITSKKLKEYACNDMRDLEEGKDIDFDDMDENTRYGFFDNAVIVIDEIHNLIRLMQGNIIPYITKRKGRARKIKEEPIVPGRWVPGLCDKPENYKRAYLFYRLLTDARNSKIIGLSGTPIINFPEELGILANVLAGYTECVEFDVDTTDDDDLEEIKEAIEQEPRVDIVRYQKSDRKTEFLVSLFNEGYIRDDEGKTKEGASYTGLRFTEEEEGQETIKEVYERIKDEVDSIATITSERFVSYPRLPIDDETFRKEFINPVDLSIRNKLVLQKRITGLISYYATSNEALMPRVAKDEFVRCEMSDYTLNMYSKARKKEIAGELNKKKESGDIFAAVEMFAKMKNPSSYRFRSRALCNFSFPETIPRPFPEDQEVIDDELAMNEDEELLENSADPEADKLAVENVQEEDEDAVLPEEEYSEEVAQQEESSSASSASSPSSPSSASSASSPSSASSALQQGGAGDEPAKPVVAAKKKGLTPAQLARLEAIKAAKQSAESSESSATTSEDKPAPSEPASATPVVVKTFGTEEAKAEASPSLPVTFAKKIKKPVSAATPSAATPSAATPSASSEATPSASSEATTNVATTSDTSAVEEPSKEVRPTIFAKKIKKPVAATEASVVNKVSDAVSSATSGMVSAVKSVVTPPQEIVVEEKEEAKPTVFAKKKLAIKKPEVDATKEPSKPATAEPTPSVAATSTATTSTATPVSVKKLSIKKPEVEPPAPVPSKKLSIKKPEVEQAAPIVEEKESEEPEEEVYVTQQALVPYKEMIRRAMEKLEEKRDSFLKLDALNEEQRLSTYSNKLDRMIRNILKSKGSNLVYSQFKTVEGLGVLGVALKANGFSEIVVEGSDADPYLSAETVASLEKGPDSGEKRFISFTGEGSKERRGLILNIFNGNIDKLPPRIQTVFTKHGYDKQKNIRGGICWVIGITGAGAEGISLKCCRSVHIMESYWNNVRLDQVKGRAIRICSHTDLPYAERDVDIYTYCSVFSDEQKRSKLDITLKTSDNNETSDEHVYNVSIRKDKINQAILTVMKEAAVDCGLNSAHLENVRCLRIDGPPDQYMFDPNLDVDKRITGIQFKEEIEKGAYDIQEDEKEAPSSSSAVEKSISQASKKPARSRTMLVDRFQLDGKEYYLLPDRKDNRKLKIYDPFDEDFTKPIGEISLDPITGKPSGISWLNKA